MNQQAAGNAGSCCITCSEFPSANSYASEDAPSVSNALLHGNTEQAFCQIIFSQQLHSTRSIKSGQMKEMFCFFLFLSFLESASQVITDSVLVEKHYRTFHFQETGGENERPYTDIHSSRIRR
jgi:hypothetical protein